MKSLIDFSYVAVATHCVYRVFRQVAVDWEFGSTARTAINVAVICYLSEHAQAVAVCLLAVPQHFIALFELA